VPTADPNAFLGEWKYTLGDQVTICDGETATNSILGTPLVIRRELDGTFIGKDFTGCEWRFQLQGDALELDPTPQTCTTDEVTATHLFQGHKRFVNS